MSDESRRDRNKRLKREAILAAAAELFRERGYDAVTTQEIAERADVSNGTFFRYARTKSDLLVAVMTERVVRGRLEGVRLAREGGSVTDAVLALLTPLAELSLAHPELALAYQRELLFGAREDRAEELDEVEQLQHAIAEILHAHAGAAVPRDQVEFAALAIYSTVYIDLVRFAVGRDDFVTLVPRLERDVTALVEGLLQTAR